MKKGFLKNILPKLRLEKKMLGNKFESFQNRDPEDTSTIKIEFFLIRQRLGWKKIKLFGMQKYEVFVRFRANFLEISFIK